MVSALHEAVGFLTKGGGKLTMVVIILLFCLLIRYTVSLSPYSGMNRPPLFGDYEAQRHWTEITLNLPSSEWYHNTSKNNLQYWGLDYPPLTAYHSCLMGKIFAKIDPKMVELQTSHGYETYLSKIVMRMSVFTSDLLIYFPAALLLCFWSSLKTRSFEARAVSLLLLLLQPAIILIDHGHFQYNCVSLGLVAAAVACIVSQCELIGSALFSLALNYKQMSLYYAPAFFTYLLAKNLSRRNVVGSFVKIATIGLVVLATFAVCWLPFLHSRDEVLQVLHRVFPTARGLFEDKVSNFWCSISPVFKWQKFSPQLLLRLCAGLTLLGLLPSNVLLFLRPNPRSFLYTLFCTSMSFFLFSYQVHEKSILLPLLPVSLLLDTHKSKVVWLNVVGTFSMFPLLYKDGLLLPYIAVAFAYIIFYIWSEENFSLTNHWKQTLSLFGMCAIHAINFSLTPPAKYPDLFVLILSVFSFLHFFGAFLYVHLLMWRDGRLKQE